MMLASDCQQACAHTSLAAVEDGSWSIVQQQANKGCNCERSEFVKSCFDLNGRLFGNHCESTSVGNEALPHHKRVAKRQAIIGSILRQFTQEQVSPPESLKQILIDASVPTISKRKYEKLMCAARQITRDLCGLYI